MPNMGVHISVTHVQYLQCRGWYTELYGDIAQPKITMDMTDLVQSTGMNQLGGISGTVTAWPPNYFLPPSLKVNSLIFNISNAHVNTSRVAEVALPEGLLKHLPSPLQLHPVMPAHQMQVHQTVLQVLLLDLNGSRLGTITGSLIYQTATK